MEKKVETTIAHWGYIGLRLGLYKDNGNENGNYDITTYSYVPCFACFGHSGVQVEVDLQGSA